MKSIFCFLSFFGCGMLASVAQAQLITFQGRTNFLTGAFDTRFRLGDTVTGSINYREIEDRVSPQLWTYQTDILIAVDGEILVQERTNFGTMSDGAPSNIEGWDVGGNIFNSDGNTYSSVVMHTTADIMSEPANPPNGIPIAWFDEADGFVQITHLAAPIENIRWDITSYQITPLVAVPEPSSIAAVGATVLVLITMTKGLRRRSQSARDLTDPTT